MICFYLVGKLGNILCVGNHFHLTSAQIQKPLESVTDCLLSPETTDPSATSHSHGSHVAPGVVIETFNLPDQGDGVPPEIGRVRI